MRRLFVASLMFHPAALSAAEPAWPAPVGTVSFTLGENIEHPVFRTTNGVIWNVEGGRGNTVCRLVRWTGSGWEKTPPLDLPHSAWERRSLPPWHYWHSPLSVIVGDKGSLLAVAVGDIYQQAPDEKEADDPDVQDVVGLKKEQAVALNKRRDKHVGPDRDGTYSTWYVGWLFDGGKWVGPLELGRLLAQERESLAKLLPRAHPGHGPFNVVSDGKNIWAFFGNKVHAITAKGTAVWDVPAAPKESPRLNRVKLAAVEGAVWCAWAKGRQRSVTALTVQDGKIEAKDLPEAAPPPDGSPTFGAWSFHVGRDGRLFYTGAALPKGPQKVLLWKDGKWQPYPELRTIAAEDDDGSVWCLPIVRKTPKANGYRIIKGNDLTVVPAPEHIRLGFLTDAGPGRKTGTAHDTQLNKPVIVEWKANKDAPGGWAPTRVWYHDDPGLDQYRVFVDAKGVFIQDTGAIGKVKAHKEQP